MWAHLFKNPHYIFQKHRIENDIFQQKSLLGFCKNTRSDIIRIRTAAPPRHREFRADILSLFHRQIKIKDYFALQPVRFEQDAKNRWNLLDYGEVVVHVLQKEERETYAIEKFWNHAFSVSEDEWKKESEEYSEYINK